MEKPSKVYLTARVAVLYLTLTLTVVYTADKLTYISIEQATTLYHDKDYISDFKFVAFRFGRASPVYYVDLNFTALVWFGNNFSMDFYFYEFLSNRYQRSFVEMHFKFCKLIHEDLFFGAAMKQGKLDGPCPYPPGDYGLQNMTILPDAIPSGFPFTKGRIYLNMTYLPKNHIILQIYANMEIRQIKIKNRKKMNKL